MFQNCLRRKLARNLLLTKRFVRDDRILAEKTAQAAKAELSRLAQEAEVQRLKDEAEALEREIREAEENERRKAEEEARKLRELKEEAARKAKEKEEQGQAGCHGSEAARGGGSADSEQRGKKHPAHGARPTVKGVDGLGGPAGGRSETRSGGAERPRPGASGALRSSKPGIAAS